MDINYLLQDFISNNKYICELAIAEGWIGNYYQTQISEGLLGYMVFSYQKQDAILNNKEEALKFPFRYNPDDMKELKDFFCLNFFRDDVIRNGKITHFFKREHFNIIKKYDKMKYSNLNFDKLKEHFENNNREYF